MQEEVGVLFYLYNLIDQILVISTETLDYFVSWWNDLGSEERCLL